MKKYRKKPVIIEAVQLRRDNWHDLKRFIDDGVFVKLVTLTDEGDETPFINEAEKIGMYIKTLEGQVLATETDYIIRGVDGEFYPCKESIFNKTYEPINETDPGDEYLN